MPSVSPKQERFMRAVAHSPEFARKVGVSQSVGREFDKADQAKAEAKPRPRSRRSRLYGKD